MAPPLPPGCAEPAPAAASPLPQHTGKGADAPAALAQPPPPASPPPPPPPPTTAVTATPSDRYERRIRRAKRAAQSELSVSRGEWTRNGHAGDPALASGAGLADALPRVRLADLAPGEFAARFERPRLPCVIVDAADAWPAPPGHPLWTPAGLGAALGPTRLKVGTDDDGRAVRLAFDDFLDYAADPAHGRADDSPLYVFDGSFADSETDTSSSDDGGGEGGGDGGGDKTHPPDAAGADATATPPHPRPRRHRPRRHRRSGPGAAIAAAYTIPPPFREDLLAHAGPRRRPPHRWLVAGPPRSGSGVHVDPLATAAWNTLLAGRKRWALFPPGTPAALVAPREAGLGREAPDWFARVYPRARAPGWPGPPVLDCVQEAGETVYVPGGWWHAVLNLPSSDGGGGGSSASPDLAIAVTHNFASTANFPRVWRAAAVGRPRMAAAWLRALDGPAGRGDLARVAVRATVAGLDKGSGSSSSSSSSSGSSSSSSSSCSDEEEGDEGRSRPMEH
jgi:histone arginine demethylase JMJD6